MIKHSLVTKAKATFAAALISATVLSTTPAMAGPAATPGVIGPVLPCIGVSPLQCLLLGNLGGCEPTAIVTDPEDPRTIVLGPEDPRWWRCLTVPFFPFSPTP